MTRSTRTRGFLLAAVCGAGVVAAAACSGGGGGGGANGTLSSGGYEIINVSGNSDSCHLFGYQDAANLTSAGIDVIINGATSTFGGLDATYDNGSLKVASDETIDFNTDPLGLGQNYDCVTSLKFNITANADGTDFAHTSENDSLSEVSGTQCADLETALAGAIGAPVQFPCTAKAKYDLVKVAPPPTPTPPVNGSVTAWSGSNAELTITGTSSTGNTMSIAVTANANDYAEAGAWTCYAPDVAGGFPNYEFFYFGTDVGFVHLMIPPANWTSAGPIAVDGSAVTLELDVPEGSTYATSGGSLMLDRAPVNADAGEYCQFHLVTPIPITNGITFASHRTRPRLGDLGLFHNRIPKSIRASRAHAPRPGLPVARFPLRTR